MGVVLSAATSILFHGLAFAMVLYIVSVGLSVTMGLMGFVNLAHGAFAMAGGYVAVTLMNTLRCAVWPRTGLRPSSWSALVGAVLERTLYARLYGASELEQVLFTIGLIFMAGGHRAQYAWGPLPLPVHPPAICSGQFDLGFRTLPVYRAFLIVVELRADPGIVARHRAHATLARACAPPSTTGAWRRRSASIPRCCSL